MTDINIDEPDPVIITTSSPGSVVINIEDQVPQTTVDVTTPNTAAVSVLDKAACVPIIFPQPTDIFLYITEIEYDDDDRAIHVVRSDGSEVFITYNLTGGVDTVTKTHNGFTATLTAQYVGDLVVGFVRT